MGVGFILTPTFILPLPRGGNVVELAHQLADRAGEIIRPYWQTPVAVDSKADASPVTLADREAEAAMRALIEQHYPEHGIIGEEHGNVRPEAAYQWVLDPIDGTRAFIAGTPTFTTLIALCKDGIPILGIIDQPITKERWVGIAGQKTTLNGAPVHTAPCNDLPQATLAATAMQYFTPEQTAVFERVREHCGKVEFGGDAYLFARLASGTLDIVIEAGMKPYDFCALVPVIEGAGGVITDWDGKPLTTTSDGTVMAAASKELHRDALVIL